MVRCETRRAPETRASATPTFRAPAGSSGSRTSGSSAAGPGRRAAARSSPARRSAPGRASASSISAPRRAERRPSSRSSRDEVVAVEKHEGRARELEANVAPARAHERPRRARRRARASRRPPRLRPRARRRALLRDSACSPPAPTCAGARSRSPSSSSSLLARRPRARPARAARSRTRSARSTGRRTRTVVDELGLEPDDLGAEWPGFRHPTRPKFLLTLAARPPHVGLLRRENARRELGATGCARPRSSRRSTRPTSRGSGSRSSALLDAGVRIFHFDVGDGHFVEPVTIGPVVLESIAPLVHERGGVLDCHLMVDEPGAPHPADREGGRRQRHRPPRGRGRARSSSSSSPASTASASASRSTRSPRSRTSRRARPASTSSSA